MADIEGIDVEDDHPDIHDLFRYYNQVYFEGKLGPCSVKWSSKRMTLCAGVCHYSAYGGCDIRLSEPLLKFRPVSDLKNTLLHEMIHAYLFLTDGNKDHDDHGPSFLHMMAVVNNYSRADKERPDGGYAITVYHKFNDEVELYRVHHWRCAKCGDLIKRAMNRTPSFSDCVSRSEACSASYCHWHQHKRICGGSYEKIHEPAGYVDKRKQSTAKGAGKQNNQFVHDDCVDLTKTGQKRKSSNDDRGISKKGTKGPPVHVKVGSLEKYFSTVEGGETIAYRQPSIGEEESTAIKPVEDQSESLEKKFSVFEMCGDKNLCTTDSVVLMENSREKATECKGEKPGHCSAVSEKRNILKLSTPTDKEGSTMDLRTTRSRKRTPILSNQGKAAVLSKASRQDGVGKDSSGACPSSSRRKKRKTSDEVLGIEGQKEPVVILAWANYVSYESDEEYEEPLVDKRTERRNRENCLELVVKGKEVMDPSEVVKSGATRDLCNRSQCPMETCDVSPLEIELHDGNANQVVILTEDEEKFSRTAYVLGSKDELIELSDDEDVADGTGEVSDCVEDRARGRKRKFIIEEVSDSRNMETEHQEGSRGIQRETSKKGEDLLQVEEISSYRRKTTAQADVMKCPICRFRFPANEGNDVVNNHVDKCLELS